MNEQEHKDLYPVEHNEPEQTQKQEKRPSGRKSRTFAAAAVGAIVGILICAVIFALTAGQTTSTAAQTSLDYQDKLDLILNYLRLYYLNDLDEDELGDLLAKGLMENIGDKYSEYYTQEEFDRLMEESSGSYAGIGVSIAMNDDGYVEVYRVFADSPAQEAGILIKDLIVEADEIRDFETVDDLVSIVRGLEGTEVDLVISRGGEEIPMTVMRKEIIVDSVYGEMLTDGLGYIQIAEFNKATIQQFNDIVDDLLQQGMTAAVMDLRANPGGDYDAVVAVSDRVLPEGVIVTVEDKVGGVITENSDATCLDIPMVVLIDENTASAAELFTMALHDYDMAQTVGTTTYGKGIVQSIFRLYDGSGLKFTTEKYYGPAGNSIQDTGIEPDYVVEFPEEVYEDGVITLDEDVQLQKAVELLGFDVDFEALAESRAQEDEPDTTSPETDPAQ